MPLSPPNRPRRTPSPALTLGLAAAALLVAAALVPRPTTAARPAALFTVNSTADTSDANTADNLCDDGAGRCTLRAAIEQANASPGPDTIVFSIGSGVQTITQTSDFPVVSDPVVIDATTQPGYSGAPIVEVNGNDRFITNRGGFVFTAGSSVIRGLVINRVPNFAIVFEGLGSNRAEGNYLGTNVAGDQVLDNFGGILIKSPGNVVGGTTAAARNVISGNRSDGILLSAEATGNLIIGNYIGTNAAGDAPLGNVGSGIRGLQQSVVGGTEPGMRNVISGNAGDGVDAVSGNTIQGNFIGTNATGTAAIPNFSRGVRILAGTNNQIGGTSAAARNVISGNESVGVSLESGASGNVVEGNFIGTDATGTRPVPNVRGPQVGAPVGGVALLGPNNRVGGTAPGAANVIAFNGGPGIGTLVGANFAGNTLRGNSVFANNGLGIELSPVGVTPNDFGDADNGVNNLQNFPVVTAVTTDGATTTVRGAFNSTPSTNFELDFYATAACDPSGNGEGARHLGSASVGTDAGGDAAFLLTLPAPLPAGHVVTATATNPSGSTSEFSPCNGAGASTGLLQFGDPAPAHVREDVGAALIPVVRVGGSAGTLTVNVTTHADHGEFAATPGQDFTPVNQTLTFGPGETLKHVAIPVANDGVSESLTETFTVTLSSPNAPDVLAYPAELVVRLFDRVLFNNPLLTFNSASAREGDAGAANNAVITVRLSLAVGHTVTVDYQAVGVSATAGTDFQQTSGTLTFAPGETSKTVVVPVVGDTLDEANQTFTLQFSNAVGASFDPSGGPQSTIVDDDASPVILVGDASVVEGTTGTVNAVFPVSLSAPSELFVSVNYSTADGTATAGSDYQQKSGSVLLSPGATTGTIVVVVNGDSTDEPVERFFLNLTAPANGTLADARAVGTIGQPGSPTVEFAQPSFAAGEGAHLVNVTVTRAGDASGPASVGYATQDTTASERSDYTTAGGTLRFAAGETTKTFAVLLTEDAFAEDTETVRLVLTDVEGALLGAQSSALVSITNDAPPAAGNPIDDARVFVRQHYHDFLNRDPDEAGLQFWTNQITSCGGDAACVEQRRVSVSSAFFLSIEFQNTGYQVIRIYKASFPHTPARPRGLPRYREFLRDTQEIGRGVVVGVGDWEQQLRDNTRAFARRWVASPEFLAEFPATMTAAEFVDRLFLNAQVVPTPQERDAALAAYGAGDTEGRAAALLSVTNSGSVFNKQYNPAFVLMQYISYLRRNPDDAPDTNFDGYDFWLTKLNSFSQSGGDVRDEAVAIERVGQAEMIRAFITSIEYRRRFGQ